MVEQKFFRLSDIFEIKKTKLIDHNKLIQKIGNIPYVTRTGLNNGILQFVCEQNIKKINFGNVITIGVDTQTVFYQKQDFYSGDKILYLTCNNMNQYIGIFIVGILDIIIKKKFNYGHGATLVRVKNLDIKLPTTSDGKPDWEFMESYIREQYQEVVQERIEELEKKKPDAPIVPRDIADIKATADFPLGQVFPTITRGIQISKRNRKPGTLPYISASLLNHGEADFVSVDEKYIYKNCLTVPFIGGENCTFYHDGEFVPSASVAVLQNENFNKYIYVFLIGILNVIMRKYSFGYKASLERLQKQTIPLPITSEGKPDWDFMSDYIKTQSQIVFEEELKRLKSKLDE